MCTVVYLAFLSNVTLSSFCMIFFEFRSQSQHQIAPYGFVTIGSAISLLLIPFFFPISSNIVVSKSLIVFLIISLG